MLIKKFTFHAIQRMQQRGKNQEGVKLVLRHGVRRPHQDGFFLRRKEATKEIERRRHWISRLEKRTRNRRANQHIVKAMRRRVQTIERMTGCVVVEKKGQVITVYDRVRRAYN